MAKKAATKKATKARKEGLVNVDGAPEFDREVPVELTDEELSTQGHALAEAEELLESQLAAKRNDVASHNEQIKGTREKIQSLAAQIMSGKKMVKVRCFEHRNFGQNVVEIVRADCGEIVDRRAMTAEDRQEDLV